MEQKSKELRRKVTFNYSPPRDDVKDASVVGDFNHWEVDQTKMKPQKDGMWKVTVSLPPGSYEYKFLIDGKWEADPSCPDCVINPFGTINSKLVIS